jgi:lipopolysaccharide transport protein LptA
MRNGFWWTIVVLVFLFASPCAAEEKTSQAEGLPNKSLAPEMSDIEEFRLIHADSMTLTRQADKPQVFEGAVDIIMADEQGQETRIKADKMTVYYEQSLKKIERVEAEGRVKITRLGSTATTELAVFRGDKNTIELLIDPHVKDSRGELSANKIVIFMNTDEVVAEGNVRGIVHPQAFKEAAEK